jgi:hypothetical protein
MSIVITIPKAALPNQNDPCRHNMDKYTIKQQISPFLDYKTISGQAYCRHKWRMVTGLDNTDLKAISVLSNIMIFLRFHQVT